ncbi:MAG TPA: hypothetical protein VNA44_11840 [Burkholderiaceae bacterium]|nr:hypothetical protein [Burkholderiaceae bacterium]
MANSLQIEDHQDFQRRQWRAERIGWMAMALLIVAAVAGLLGGGGVLADASSASADGRSRVEYQRFARKGSTTTLEIIAASGERELRIRIDERYLSAMSLRTITPPPLATVLSERSYTFSFNRAPGAIDTRIKLHLEPDSAGSLEGTVTIDDAAPLRIRHFIFP